MVAYFHVGLKILQVASLGAELALSHRVFTLHRVMPNLFTLADLHSTAVASNFHMEAVIKLMSSKDELFIGQLVTTFVIVASEPYLPQVLGL